MTHAWCSDPSRDAAVRAAEDGRDRPLPTLEQCIEQQKQTARPCGGTDPAPSRGERGAADTGMRTERVTLEVTHGNPWRITAWEWSYILRLGTGESVRVVDTHAEAVAESVAWEGARDAYRGRILRLTEERDAANRERDAAVAESERRLRLCETMKRDGDSARFHAAVAHARVAELEQSIKLCSGSCGFAGRSTRAASGGGEGEPVAWMCEWTDHVGLHHTKTDAEDEANGDIVPQPLYRSPPQPRGWLTGEESALVKSWERHYMQGAHYAQSPSHTNDIAAEMGKLAEVCKSILARSTPPKVEIPEILFARLSVEEIGQLTAALAAAGVAVKEVGRE
jgi:hypothetical protein